MKPRALKFVSHERIEDHLRLGWVISFPNAAMHHHLYSAELMWLCDCEIPGGFGRKSATTNRRSNHGRSRETV